MSRVRAKCILRRCRIETVSNSSINNPRSSDCKKAALTPELPYPDAALAALIKKHEKDAPYNIAYVHAFRGEADKAFEWLDKAVEYNDSGLADVVSENLFEKIHSDPRWLPFLRKIGKAPEQLAQIQFKVTLPP